MTEAYELFQEGKRLIGRRRPREAVDLLRRAKELEPRRGSILEALGIAYFNSGQTSLASREFEEALEVDPTNHFARYGLGCCLYRQGRLAEAVGQMKLALAMAPHVELYSETLRRYQRDLERESGRDGGEAGPAG
jgi:Flp pilus assembly protein TadD